MIYKTQSFIISISFQSLRGIEGLYLPPNCLTVVFIKKNFLYNSANDYTFAVEYFKN